MRRLPPRLVLLLVLGFVLGAAACARDAAAPLPAGPASAAAAQVVARVAGAPVTAGDVATQMRAAGVDRARALADLVTFELLARAAADARVERDAADADATMSLIVERLIERDLEPRLTAAAIPEADVRALYERGRKRFVHGRQVQVAVLCVYTGARMKPAPRARAEQSARALAAFVAARPARDAADFDVIARDPAWTDRRVSATTVWQDEDEPFPAVVGRAVAALGKPGDTTALVGDETGYYLARYIAERPPAHVSFEQAAPGLRAEMFEPWRRRRFVDLVHELARGHEVEVFPENFPLLASADTDDRAAR